MGDTLLLDFSPQLPPKAEKILFLQDEGPFQPTSWGNSFSLETDFLTSIIQLFQGVTNNGHRELFWRTGNLRD